MVKKHQWLFALTAAWLLGTLAAVFYFDAGAVAAQASPSATIMVATQPSGVSRHPIDKTHQKLLVGYIGLIFLILILTGVILQIVLMGALRRAVLPGGDKKKGKTPYVDAWAVAGERMREKPLDDLPPP